MSSGSFGITRRCGTWNRVRLLLQALRLVLATAGGMFAVACSSGCSRETTRMPARVLELTHHEFAS